MGSFGLNQIWTFPGSLSFWEEVKSCLAGRTVARQGSTLPIVGFDQQNPLGLWQTGREAAADDTMWYNRGRTDCGEGGAKIKTQAKGWSYGHELQV